MSIVEAKTGRKGLQYREAIQKLREISFIKTEQSKILYEAIEKQRTEIALQQQIITCLEYRFALEHLPQRDTSEVKILSKPSATSAWQRMWTLAVERELEEMIDDYIKTFNPGHPSTAANTAPAASAMVPVTSAAATPSTGTTSSSAASTAIPSASSTTGSAPLVTPPSLRELLQSDFRFWAKSNLNPNPGKNNTNSPGRKKGKKGSWPTAQFPQVKSYQPEYDKWPSFTQGYNFYSELSANIHTYNRSFDIQEINFTKSQRDILKWLKPDPDAIDPQSKEVDWRKVWVNRGLPT
ncbi:hypothetical protein MMC29_006373 [Sticta canariensis]|nr:hypothetical protein [Sticta canariensis]